MGAGHSLGVFQYELQHQFCERIFVVGRVLELSKRAGNGVFERDAYARPGQGYFSRPGIGTAHAAGSIRTRQQTGNQGERFTAEKGC